MRKQLARALRQEGKVLEAIVELMTADSTDTGGPSSNAVSTAGGGTGSAGSGKGSAGGEGAGSGDVDALGEVRGGVVYPDFMTLEQGADAWAAAAQWPAGPQAEPTSLLGRLLARLWRGGKAGSRRITSRISMTLRGSRPNLHKEAESMGIHPGEQFEGVAVAQRGTQHSTAAASGVHGASTLSEHGTARTTCGLHGARMAAVAGIAGGRQRCASNPVRNSLSEAIRVPPHPSLPDMYSAVEHVYAMSGPTAASMQARQMGLVCLV